MLTKIKQIVTRAEDDVDSIVAPLGNIVSKLEAHALKAAAKAEAKAEEVKRLVLEQEKHFEESAKANAVVKRIAALIG